jgi:hypothetical protein
MWIRNIAFVVALLVAGVLCRGYLFPTTSSSRQIPFDQGMTQDADFRSTLAQLNASFRQTWAAENLEPAAPADDLTVARRMSLALTGTVPSLEEIRQFERLPAGQRLDVWANYLLKDRRFGDYFGSRLTTVFVGTLDGPLISYRKRKFRAWVGENLMKNTSYGQLVRQMISDQGLNTESPAVNWIAATYDDDRKSPDIEKLTVRLSRSFLGLRLDCAQCHDHFLEPSWKQTDFQALAAFFGQTSQVVTHVHDKNYGEYEYDDRKGGKHQIAPAVPVHPELLPDGGTRRERLAQWLTHPKNTHFSRAVVNRMWFMMFNKPLLKRVEAQTLQETGPLALKILAEDFAAHNYNLHRLLLLIASSEVFRLSSASEQELSDSHEEHLAIFPITRLRPEQVIGTIVQATNVRTINRQSNIFVQLGRFGNERDFIQQYGEDTEDEVNNAGETIPQRLILMNGNLVDEKVRPELPNAATQVAMMAPNDRAAVESCYLMVLSRRPSEKELSHFVQKLENSKGDERSRRVSDLLWALVNSSEVGWNH